MGFAALGNFGTNNSFTSNNALAVTLGSTIPVGSLVVVWSAWDNNNGSTGIGPVGVDGTDHLWCVDSKGNFYTTLASAASTGVSAKPHATLFIAYVATALVNGDTITVKDRFNKVAKAISVQAFSLDAGFGWASVGRDNLTNNATDPGAISLGSLPSQEYLMLHALGWEGPITDTFTWDSDYTQIAFDGTNSGTPATDMSIGGGYRIATLTGDTVDVTAAITTRDFQQLLVAVAAVPFPASFPTTPILDNFNRADESPLDNGTWDTSCLASEGTTTRLRVLTNQCAVESGAAGNCGQQWLASFGAGDHEAYVTLAVVAATNAGWIQVDAKLAGCGQPAVGTLSCAAVRWQPSGGALSQLDVFSMGGSVGVGHSFFTLGWLDAANGDRIGVRQKGDYVHAYRDHSGGGWTWSGAIWKVPSGSGDQLGLNMRTSVAQADNFGGGSVVELQHLLPILHVGA